MPVFQFQTQHAQSQVNKTPKKRSSFIVRQMNTTSMSSAITNAVVFFALLLALVIVACVLWLKKRSRHNEAQVQAYDAMIRMKSAQDEQSHVTVTQGENFRIGGKLFLPSTTIVDQAKSVELTANSSLHGRSTGLLSRYGNTHQ